MSTEYGFIILRDVPKEEARIDVFFSEIEGGFRGFQLVPAGVHYVSVQVEGTHKGFWCYLQPNEAIVKVFNSSVQQFEDDEPENTAHYQQLALAGAMGQVLIPYEQDSGKIWEQLTNYISSRDFPPPLHQEESINPPDNLSSEELSEWMQKPKKSRFEQALFDTHGGDTMAFLAELQFAFIRWFIDNEDIEALNRWRHLLQAIYNAGERGIAKAPDLFPNLIDLLVLQFDYLEDEMFTPNSFVVYGAEYLAEDMIDSDIEEVVEKGREFENYLEERGV
jgi:hypothetical protein